MNIQRCLCSRKITKLRSDERDGMRQMEETAGAVSCSFTKYKVEKYTLEITIIKKRGEH